MHFDDVTSGGNNFVSSRAQVWRHCFHLVMKARNNMLFFFIIYKIINFRLNKE